MNASKRSQILILVMIMVCKGKLNEDFNGIRKGITLANYPKSEVLYWEYIMRCIKSNRKDALCTGTWQMVIPQYDILADIKQIAPRIKKTKTITLIQGLEFETPSTFLSWWSILIFFLSLQESFTRFETSKYYFYWPLTTGFPHTS